MYNHKNTPSLHTFQIRCIFFTLQKKKSNAFQPNKSETPLKNAKNRLPKEKKNRWPTRRPAEASKLDALWSSALLAGFFFNGETLV